MTTLLTVNRIRCPGCGHHIPLPLPDDFHAADDGQSLEHVEPCSRCDRRLTLRLIVVDTEGLDR